MSKKNIGKVLLIWPYLERTAVTDVRTQGMLFAVRFPLGIGYLAAYLERELDVEVGILDLTAESPKAKRVGDKIRWGCTDEEIAAKIKEFNPDMVGVSQMFSYLEPVCENIFRIVKEINPAIATVWGGTHPTVVPGNCLECKAVDYVVQGEGEISLVELIETLNAGKSPVGLRGIGCRNTNGEKVISDQRAVVQDLDSLPLPAREKVDMSRYITDHSETNMVTSRGCPFACTFCASPVYSKKIFNARSPRAVVDEMEFLAKHYGVYRFIIQDENTTYDMDRIEGVADEILRRKLQIQWYSEAGTLIARLNRDLVHKLAKAGVVAFNMPVESGDAAVLNKMKKPLKLSKVKPVVDACREAGIRVRSFLLLGMPGETEEQMWRTCEFAKEIGFDWNYIGLVQPVPGSQIFMDLQNQGVTIDYTQMERYIAAPPEGVSDVPSEELVRLRDAFGRILNFENNYNLCRGRIDIAIHDFHDLSVRYPNDARVHHFLGLARYKKRDPRGALEAFSAAVDAYPEWRAAGGEGDLDSLRWVEALRRRLADDPDASFLPPETERNLGYAYGHASAEPNETQEVVDMGYKLTTKLDEMRGVEL